MRQVSHVLQREVQPQPRVQVEFHRHAADARARHDRRHVVGQALGERTVHAGFPAARWEPRLAPRERPPWSWRTFLAGFWLGRATGIRAWLLGLAMVVLGSVLVAVTIALGG